MPRPRQRLNLYSYNVGGPITIPKVFNRSRDKLFFFLTQEHWPRAVDLPVAQLTIPTELERRGDYSQARELDGRVIPIVDPLTRQPVPNNMIPASRLDPSGTALLKIFPLPNFFDREIFAGRFNYILQSGVKTPQRVETLKVDYNLNAMNQMALTYSGLRDEQSGARNIPTGGANWDQMRRSFVTPGRVMSARHVFIASPRTVTEFVFGYSQRPEEELIDAAELDRNSKEVVGYRVQGLFQVANPLALIPNAGFGGVQNAASLSLDGRTPLNQTQHAINITNNISRNYARHLVKGGIFYNQNLRQAQLPTTFNSAIGFGRTYRILSKQIGPIQMPVSAYSTTTARQPRGPISVFTSRPSTGSCKTTGASTNASRWRPAYDST